jgi:chemotaxis family two-component system response regulator Rcp1
VVDKKRAQILIVEDNRADEYLILDAIKNADIDANVQVVHDGQQATLLLDLIQSSSALCPDLILLDLNLPKESGEDVLRHIRKSAKCKNTRVLIVTSSDLASDREGITRLGVSGYFQKPSDYAEYLKLGFIARSLLSNESES